MENNRWDMLEWLGPDASECVLTCLDDPADVARASSVSKSWRQFVISNEFGKRLASKLCPEILNCTRVELSESNKNNPLTEPGSSNSVESQILENEHRVYTYFSHRILKSRNFDKDCTLRCIGASSTDNFPEESIENTLDPNESVDMRASYWSSSGQNDQNAPESLVYKLGSDLCLLDEIRIKPFKAYFQPGFPIYSSKKVRFKMGISKLNTAELEAYSKEQESKITEDDNYIWTYISPEYSMSQENTLQSFKLPRPVLCIGGVLKVDLLGRVQKQSMDDLYYMCVCHVKVIGRPISPKLFIDISNTTSQITLHYFPDSLTLGQSESATSAESSPSRWQSFTERIRQMGPNAILNTLFGGPLQFAQVEDYEDDEDDEYGYNEDVYASEEEEVEG